MLRMWSRWADWPRLKLSARQHVSSGLRAVLYMARLTERTVPRHSSINDKSKPSANNLGLEGECVSAHRQFSSHVGRSFWSLTAN